MMRPHELGIKHPRPGFGRSGVQLVVGLPPSSAPWRDRPAIHPRPRGDRLGSTRASREARQVSVAIPSSSPFRRRIGQRLQCSAGGAGRHSAQNQTRAYRGCLPQSSCSNGGLLYGVGRPMREHGYLHVALHPRTKGVELLAGTTPGLAFPTSRLREQRQHRRDDSDSARTLPTRRSGSCLIARRTISQSVESPISASWRKKISPTCAVRTPGS